MRICRLKFLLTMGFLIAFTWIARAQGDLRQQVESHYERAQAALAANELDKAVNEFRAILQLDPQNAEVYGNLGMIAYRRGKYGEAKDAFSKALRIKPQLTDAKAFLGLSELGAGESEQGESLIRESFPRIANKELKIEAGVALVRLHEASHSLGSVVEIVRDLETLAPGNPEVLYLAYRVYSGLAAQAIDSLQQGGNSARVHQILAQSAVTQDDFPGAIKEYRLAIEADPHLPGIHYELGRTILTNGQDEHALQQAKSEFELEIAANPSDAESEFELGEVYRLASDTVNAESCYRRALELRPNLGAAHLALAGILSASGKNDEALGHYLEAVRLNADDETAHYKLAQAYRTAGKVQEANDEMAKFVKLKQAHIAAHPLPNNRIKDGTPH